MSDYWYWHPLRAKLDAEDRDREEWVAGVKERLGLVCIGDEPVLVMPPYWPDLPEGAKPGDYRVVSEHAMASYDGVHFYVKPDGMPLAEWWASLA